MGIGDGGRIEAWLAEEAVPGAFYFRLPEHLVVDLVCLDWTAMVCSAFLSCKRVATANDLVAELQHVAVPMFQSEAPPCSWTQSEANVDLEDGCTVTMMHECPSRVPSLDTLADQPRSDFLFSERGVVCMSSDDGRYTPSIRSMLHEERYGDKKDDDLDASEWRVLGSHPLPGGSDAKLRSAAYANRNVRRALRYYAPLVLAGRLVEERQCPTCHGLCAPLLTRPMRQLRALEDNMDLLRRAHRLGGQEADRLHDLVEAHLEDASRLDPSKDAGCACDNRPQTESTARHLVLDAIATDFDMEAYAVRGLANRAAPSTQSMCIDVESGRIVTCTPRPAIGECDLKLVDDILRYSGRGANVLVKNRDSDIPHVLLQNMSRFIDMETGEFTRRIFVDTYHPRNRMERFSRRYVFLNRLYLGLGAHARSVWQLDRPDVARHAAAAVSAAAFFSGCDYTSKIPRVTGLKLVNALKNAPLMCTAVEEGVLSAEDHDLPGVDANDPRCLVSIILTDTFCERFLSGAMMEACSVAARKELAKEWPKDRYTFRRLRSATTGKAALLSETQLWARCHRVCWTLNYAANAPLGIGAFPSPTWQPTPRALIWGWCWAEKHNVKGQKKDQHVDDVRAVQSPCGASHEAMCVVNQEDASWDRGQGTWDLYAALVAEYRSRYGPQIRRECFPTFTQ